MHGTIGDNRLYPEEQALLAAVRRWFRYRTPENLRHVVLATKDWIRAEHRRENAGRVGLGRRPENQDHQTTRSATR